MNAVRHDRQMEMYVGLQKQQHKMYGPKKKIRARQNKRERGIIDIAAQRKNESIKNLSTGDG